MTIFAWMVGLFILLALLWVTTELSLRQEEQRVRSHTTHQAISLTNSYATQLTFVIEQMNQILLRIHSRWQDTPDLLDLARDRELGLFPDRHEFFIFIVDTKGKMVKASGVPNQRDDFFGAGYFEAQKTYCCHDLLITIKNRGSNINDKVIFFSRRLNNHDGGFDGVVVISVQSGFLATFQDESLRNKYDFIGVRLTSGPLLVTRMGAIKAPRNTVYLRNPDFEESNGVRLESAEKFRDNKARYVAWRKLKDYPLVTLVGLEEDALANY